ncbi:hypothetical protein [Winogradskyella helgolandensis]|uniref:hypothetical protein n=1 Tax=Winogradskyella helgolandensis TaxID=2697010 RepID=UPI0015CBFF42|nr:hypothetical protein [Winogradskyella helgolandensis]
MKYLLIVIIGFSIVSCQRKENHSLAPLKIDNIDNVSFLMHQMNLDSVFEIITYGKYASANKGDTVNVYTSNKENVIRQKLKSFMCCSFAFKYDSLGFLIAKNTFFDYETDYAMDYQMVDNQIIVTEKDNFNNTLIYFYKIEDERLISRTVKHKLDTTCIENVKFHYNSKNQLIKRFSEARNHFEDEFDYMKTVKTYSWDSKNLYETREKQYFKNGIDYYETVTKFDLDGFPFSKSIQKNMDTIAKTRIVKF